jgi:hypothetical protein
MEYVQIYVILLVNIMIMLQKFAGHARQGA